VPVPTAHDSGLAARRILYSQEPNDDGTDNKEDRTMTLTQKTCVPCQGGIPPLSRDEAAGYMEQVPGWELSADGDKIERKFDFPDFKSANDFVDKVGNLAEAEGHHPDIAFGWGYANVVFYTHKINGLHENDFIMAAKVNGLA
jgi:4a-hydroxytetrahydrobiopterin dehydratase